jgi:hypothetical protein
MSDETPIVDQSDNPADEVLHGRHATPPPSHVEVAFHDVAAKERIAGGVWLAAALIQVTLAAGTFIGGSVLIAGTFIAPVWNFVAGFTRYSFADRIDRGVPLVLEKYQHRWVTAVIFGIVNIAAGIWDVMQAAGGFSLRDGHTALGIITIITGVAAAIYDLRVRKYALAHLIEAASEDAENSAAE